MLNDYTIRPAAEADLDRLCELEELCWQHTRTPRQQLLARLQKYPQGHLVLEKDGKVLGVIYSQRIVDADAILTRTAADVHELHDESGSVIQLLAVNLDPQAQNAGYGDQLLELLLQRCEGMADVQRVVGVTLTKRFDPAQGTSFDDYIRQQGSAQDPVLAFHYAHGAEIVKAVPGYRPEDFTNLHNGVLVAYDIHNRPQRRGVSGAAVAKLDRQQIAQFVRSQAAQLLSIAESDFDVDRPLMEMGLDSADLLKLQRLCEERFGLQLQAGFFFEHSTVGKVVDHLAGKQEAAVSRVIVRDERPNADRFAATDIAIVGIACKLPGGIETPADLWRVLSSGECVIGSFPTSRRSWPASAEYAAIDQGGFVADADAFDAAFFRMSPAEAQITDPQQRILMQLAWKCLEDAGILPAALKGSNTGVFVGASNNDYSRLVQEAGLEIEAHNGVGSSLAILANRISYFFDLSGPSLVVDTACSSSLVALHSAVHSLRSGECSTALVGGVNFICHPDLSVAYHKAGMLAPDGRCKTFDASANGYVRSEGSVLLLLKPVKAAVEDGNRIHAVIRGTATNHGGLAGGLTVPNPQKQKELLLAAWKDAGIAAADLSYFEAHGTGTSLGDPIEIQGLQAAYAEHSTDRHDEPCAIGSVKSNLGHLESAAGITGLLKVVLAMQHRQLPATVNFRQLNPKIRLAGTPFVIQERLADWNAQQPRVAAVSSFGSGGANAHVVVQEYASATSISSDEPQLFVLSAANDDRLRAYAADVMRWLETEANFADAIYTWQVGRTAMKQRLAIKTTGAADLRSKLTQWLAGERTADVWSGNGAQKDATLARMWQTKAGRQLIEQAVIDRDLDALGTLWTSGTDIDWRKSYEGAKRQPASVPTYPFAKDRFWIEAARKDAKPAAAASVIHPLLHTNTSNLNQQSYSAVFSGEEFFLADHQVRAQKVLPGVAYLEMARAAVEHALPAWPEATALELQNTVWIQPIVANGKTAVSMALAADDDDTIDYEVYSEDGEQRFVHCQGRALLTQEQAPAKLDLGRLESEMGEGSLDASSVYATLARMGLVYGPAFQTITSIQQGRGELLARLRLSKSVPSADYILHPSVVDGAVQAAVGLIDGWSGASGEPRLPFALESLRIVSRCTPAMVAWVRYAPGSEASDKVVKVDIDLCDEEGNVCIQLHGFSSRVSARQAEQRTGSLLAVPVWQTGAIEDAQHVIRLSLQGDVAQSYTQQAVACFEKVQEILRSKPSEKVVLQVVVDQPLLAGLSGLLKTAMLENPQFVGQLIVDGVPQVLSWKEVEGAAAAVAFKNDGVYLITGGTGGLGLLFAKEIRRQAPKARVILTGRSTRTTQQGLEYRQLDLGNAEEVRALIASIGHIDGILHCAGMIADDFILRKSSTRFAEVLGPKVTGTVNLDQATRDLALDFFVLFSSINGAMGNVGQADYATANGFMDRFAAYRNRQVAAGLRHGRTRSINWPLWQSGGMQMDAAAIERMQRSTGMQPLQTATGIEAFHRILALPYDQVLVVEGDVAQMRRNLLGAPAVSASQADEAQAAQIAPETLAEKTQQYLRKQFSGVLKLAAQKIDPQAALEEYGIDSMLAMKLTNQLEETFGSLPKTLFFEYQTIRDLTTYFVGRYAQQLSTMFAFPAAPAVAAAPAPAATPAPVAARRPKRKSAAQPADFDAIAIVGLSGRYPEAVNVESYWNNLRDGKDCIIEVPRERWDWKEYFSEDRNSNGHHYSKWGGFISGVDEFDPLFFNISPREATYIDPQERLFLQHAWMAVEDAGYTRASLQIPREKDLPGQVGVYAGVMWSEYQLFGAEAGVHDLRMGFAGNLASIANRVSYALNLHGPSMTLDTMCSSSLTAIHVACQDLKLGRTSLAIAGGVNVSIHPNKYLMLSIGQFISSDGHCQSFGEGGDGYIPGEGVGVVVLKRLEDAKRDGDHIYGIIRGSALSHGGKTNGYTVPNPQAQASAIGQALAESRTDARHVSYVEAHGTGTKLGDPIEIAALSKAFEQYTHDTRFCLLGSAKSNIGHCESAAGIAGLTKVLLQMQHQQIVPSLHSAQLNPHIDFDGSPFVVNQALRPWEQPVIDGKRLPRIAGISSFGAGGSNVHMILEEYVEYVAPAQQAVAAPNVAILLSARTPEQLQQKAAELLAFVQARQSSLDLVASAYTLQVGREAMEERLGFVVGSAEELVRKLEAYVAGEQNLDETYQGQVKRNKEALAVFSTDSDLQQTIDKWIAGRKLAKLLDLWVKGLEVDWSKLYGDARPRRVSLPAYPFARERYWIDAAASKPAAASAASSLPVLHPLLHSNTSDLYEQRFRSTFTGEEFFLADHQVAERKVLPGVAYLEMARAAIEHGLPAQADSPVLELRNTVWAQPIVVSDKVQVSIALLADDDEQIDYEIYSQDGGQRVVHCQGHAVLGAEAAPEPLDLEQLRRSAPEQLDAERVYATCSRMGLSYGPSFQAIAAVDRGPEQLLAQLRLPASAADGYVLHPSLMDGAVQAAVVLMGSVGDEPRLPFALETLRLVSPCVREMVAVVRYAPGSKATDKVVKLDIDLCDAVGNVCVQMHGLSTRVRSKELTAAGVPAQATGNLLATPVWQASVAETTATEFAERHVFVCDKTKSYTDCAAACFEKIKAILQSKPQGKVLFQVAVSDEAEQALFAGLTGLLKTAALENPQFVGQVILAPAAKRDAYLRAENGSDALVRYDASGAREVLQWVEIAETEKAEVALKDDGVYLITGGMGGLGVLFAKEILEQTRHARVILTGRSALSAEREALLSSQLRRAAHREGSSPLAGRLSYRQVDLGDLEQVQRLVAGIREDYRHLDGILHCAGMIADRFILKKSAAELRQVLAPKVAGTLHLDEACKDAELDFFVLFSSTASALGNLGQADYAAGNGFMDQFAMLRNRQVAAGQRHGRTRSINWPLWQAGGMGIDRAGLELLQQTIGMQPMQTATGMQAFHRVLALPYDQVLVVEGDLTQVRRVLEAGRPIMPERPVAEVVETVNRGDLAEKTEEYLIRQLSGVLRLPADKIDPQAALEEYGIDSVMAMQLTNQLEQIFGSLSKTLFFEYQTIRELAAYFVRNYAAQLTATLGGLENPPHVAPSKRRADSQVRPSRRTKHEKPAEADPIAIVGLSGRYPGAADVDAYWRNLRDGKDSIVEVPQDRWDWQAHFSADRASAGRHYSKWGGFISGVDEFDPQFFNIAPKEAKYIDPQERLFLQHAWAAIEDAGYTRASLQIPYENDLPGQVGVYVGVMWSEYQLFGAAAKAEELRMGFAGNMASIANRVSYALNLHGPSMTLDTMCSSSLTAIHIACEDLKHGRTSLAIAGGVNVSVHPHKYLLLSVGQFISSDGHCQSFGEGGDGYIPGEGVGAVVLKRLSDAKRDGDHIYGIIRGSALTHGGKTNGYTVPNPQAQASAIGRTLAESHTDARHISYIEAHGTGTKLGDPIEIAALSKAFERYTKDTGFCLLGSAKSNIGHCESAAGIAGLTKVLLQMQHRQIVPSLHSAQLNPHIDFGKSPFTVNQTLRAWEQPVVDGRTLPRIAGISSFGAGGSNAHMIIEEYPQAATQPVTSANVVIVLSARTPEQLRQKAADLLDFVRTHPNVDLPSMAHTLQIGREAMKERLAIAVGSVDELVAKLEAGDVDQHEWVKGAAVDWNALYETKPQRISLPTYPFAKERYWIDVTPAVAPAAVIHPLVHRNASDLFEQRYVSTFEVGKALTLDDYLEMARVAVGHALPEAPALELRDVVYAESGDVTEVGIALMARSAEEVEFEIFSDEDVLCQGRAVVTQLDTLLPPASFSPPRGEKVPEGRMRGEARKEIPFAVLAERKRKPSITLATPAVVVASAARRKPAIALAAPAGSATPVVASPVKLTDCGNGTFSIDVPASRTSDLLGHFLQALGRAEQEPELKVLLVSGIEHCFPREERADAAIERLVSFPYPVIAVQPGDLTGAGLLAAAACDFMVCSKEAEYAALPADRFAYPRVPWNEVESHAEQLASTLATKSRDALRLLKAHLTGAPASSRPVTPASRRPVEIIRYDQLTERHESAVLLIEDVADASTLSRLILETEIPLVAAVTGSVRGNGLLLAQLCDAAVYTRDAVYSAAGIDTTLAQTAVAAFTERFGEAASELLLTAADYSGAELAQRTGATVVEQEEVIEVAKRLAASTPKQSAKLREKIRTLPAMIAWENLGAESQEPRATISLQSRVVSATAHPEGIVVVKLEDREAKNMFSDALVAGIVEAFAHIQESSAYKVVVLTGFDSYFASGGTKETLLAIQQGTTKFTDLDIYHRAVDCKLPVIAAMQGHGIGAGWSLGMFADVVLLSEESRYVSPYMDYGFTPGAGATWSLPEKMGRDLANESLLTARQYSGRELKERGLRLRVLPRAEVVPAAMELARQIARASRHRLIGLKQQLTAHVGPQLDEIYARELDMHEQTFVGRADTLAQIERNFAPSNAGVSPAAHTGVSPVSGSVLATLKTLLATELQLRENDVDDQAQFVDLGLDSISGVTWIRKINAKYGTSIEATKVYSYPTLAQLSRYVKEEAEKLGTLECGGEAAALNAVPDAPALQEKPVPAKSAAPQRATKKLTSRRKRAAGRIAAAPAARGAEPVAIIGMAGQFPQARNLQEFWQNIAGGKNCITEVPRERWDADAFYQPGDPAAGKTTSRWAGTLDGHDEFDPLFFNISPTEAENMDPQQRLFLQAAWHGIENAGYAPRALSGSKTGVFVGCAGSDYHQLSREHQLSAQGFTGSATSILAARISYVLNLQGPCVSIDTACSSSLVSIAQACDSLTAGSSDLALAGGVYVMTGPEMHIKTAQAGMLSPDGKCFTFDQRANGFVPGEGVGVVLLKRLSDAERDGDIIHAVVHGWGVNQDGKTNGITAPNPESQTRLEQDVYDRFGIDPANISLIEAHGTGTKLGDPIEVEGLKNAFRKYTESRESCAIGSVKSNIGHCLTAAGVAGVLKLVLALKHRQLPPTIHFEKLNEHISLKDSPFYVNHQLRDWQSAGARQAATSSFGFSGTNAHMVIGEYRAPVAARPSEVVTQNGKVIVPLSARTPEQLDEQAKQLLQFVRTSPSLDLLEIAYTLQIGREAMEERLGILAGSVEQLAEKLEAYVRGERRVEDVHRGKVTRNAEATSIISQDEDVKATIVAKWIANRKLGNLTELWVSGLDLDWNVLYGEAKPRRIALPVYPFARERYWIDAQPSAAVSAVHPLLQRNVSALREHRFASTFTGQELFLTDHRVRAEKFLPGVAYLEMARAAMAQASPAQAASGVVELRDIVWLKPVAVGAQPVEVSISLVPTADDSVEYEIYSVAGVHSQGQASFSRPSAATRVDLAQLRRQMRQGRIDASEVYEICNAMGLHYGPAHQGITALHLGEKQLLADLRLPAVAERGAGAYALHPSLLDSALQATIGLFVDRNNVPTRPSVPFALDAVRVLAPCTKEMTAWVRSGKGNKFDIDLYDGQGNLCVELRGFALRGVEQEARPDLRLVANTPRLPIKATPVPSPASFDDAFYESLLSDIAAGRLSIDEAVAVS